MTTTYIEIEGFEEFLQDIQDIEDIDGEAQRMFYNTMAAVMSVLEQQIGGRTPVNVGALRGSYYQNIRGQRAQMEGIYGTPLNYALPVEFGRRAGKMPPIDPIQAWVKRKLGVGDEKESRAIAWAIALHMKKHDRAGAFMFRDGIAASIPYIEAEYSKLLKNVVTYLAGGR